MKIHDLGGKNPIFGGPPLFLQSEAGRASTQPGLSGLQPSHSPDPPTPETTPRPHVGLKVTSTPMGLTS